jgi:hypothetical protein
MPKRLKQRSYADYDDDLDISSDEEETIAPRGPRKPQNVTVCSFRMAELRKAVVKKRRTEGVTNPGSKARMLTFIQQHSKLEDLPDDLDEMKLAQIRVLHKQIVSAYHSPAPSKQSRDELLKYIYFSAHRLRWSWVAVLRKAPTKTRVTRSCLGSRAPGTQEEPPTSILSRKNRPKRKPSMYNNHIRIQMQNLKGQYPDHVERFQAAVEMWNERKDDMIENQVRSRRRKEARETEAEERAERVSAAKQRRETAAKKSKKKEAADRKRRKDEANARDKSFRAKNPRKIPKRARKQPDRYAGNGIDDQISHLLYG